MDYKDEMLEIAAKALSQASYILENDMTNHAKWFKDVENRCRETLSKSTLLNGMDKPLFARVVPWQGLSDDEIKRNATKLGYLWTENSEISFKMDGFLELFARAIEQALKEKNT